jgi:hypothetical protein
LLHRKAIAAKLDTCPPTPESGMTLRHKGALSFGPEETSVAADAAGGNDEPMCTWGKADRDLDIDLI